MNSEPVTTRILFWSPEMPRFILLGTVFVLGIVAGYPASHGVVRRTI